MHSWSAFVVAWAFLLSSQMISFGLIGETPDQCAARYGVPTRHDGNSSEYRLKNRVLRVIFVEGRASCITCSDAPSERGGAVVHFQEIPEFQEPQSIGFFSASSGLRPFGFENLANLPWDLLKFLWGVKEPSALYLGMWSTHLTDPDLDVQNNWLIALNIDGFFVGTFINSYDKRSWAAGVVRRQEKRPQCQLGVSFGIDDRLRRAIHHVLRTFADHSFSRIDFKYRLQKCRLSDWI